MAFVPRQWRDISIIPIPKHGRDPNLVSALRPISLISCVCKIFHTIIQRRMEWFFEKNSLFSNDTLGFRKCRSCIDNLSRLVTRIQTGFCNDCVTVGCFIDIDNAYNNISISKLLYKLDHLGTGSIICNYLWQFLQERYLTVSVNNLYIVRSTCRGLAQGDPLSPLLFNIATIDLCKQFSTESVHISQYADDFVVYCTKKSTLKAAEQLQITVVQITQHLLDLGLEISSSKSKICIFKKGVSKQDVTIKINGTALEIVEHVKYLGLWLDSSLRWARYINYSNEQATKYHNILQFLAGSDWDIHHMYLRKKIFLF